MNRCPVCDVIEGPISQICALTRCPRIMVETAPRSGNGGLAKNVGRPSYMQIDDQVTLAEREQRIAEREAKRREGDRARSAQARDNRRRARAQLLGGPQGRQATS